MSTVAQLARQGQLHHCPKQNAIADLATVAAFYLLRPGEYTMGATTRRTRTVQFRRQDIRIWHQGRTLPHDAPAHVLLQADAATLTIDNQKNSQRGATIHHTACRDQTFCPVRALVRIILRVRQLSVDPCVPISLFAVDQHVTANDITKAIRVAAASTNLFRAGYTLDRISAHSLRASGAMALKLAGHDEATIKKIGRWSSSTWLKYIHAQIATLTAGLSEQMAVERVFVNVG
jgi:hypothetical protein